MAAIAGIATFINIFIIYIKALKGNYEHAMLDGAVFFGMAYLFSGSVTGLTASMISSALFSLTLFIFPPKFNLL
jgi:hypothetical protein